MFDPSLNATLLPAPVPRESLMAFWRTPDELIDRLPVCSVRPHPSPDQINPDHPPHDETRRGQPGAVTPIHQMDLLLPGMSGDTMVLEYRPLPLWSVLDSLVAIGPRSVGTSRSVRAWAHVARCALALAARGRLQPTIGAGGTDLWVAGPLEEADLDLVRRLGEWIPPEAFSAVQADTVAFDPTPGESTDLAPTSGRAMDAMFASGQDLDGRSAPRPHAALFPLPEEAVRALYDAVIDSIPRSPAAAAVSGSSAWALMERTDVSQVRERIQGAMVGRRSILQLRLDLPSSMQQPSALHLFVRSQNRAFKPVAAADLWSGVESFDVQLEHDVLYLLRRAKHIWAPLSRLLDQPAPTRILLDPSEVEELLGSNAADLSAEGIEVLVPAELLRDVRSAPQITTAETAPDVSENSSSGLFTVDSLCDVTWSIQVDGKDLTEDEIEKLIESKRGLIRLDDGWILVDERVIKKLRTRQTLGAARALGEALSFADFDDRTTPERSSHRDPDPIHGPSTGYSVDQNIRSFIRKVAEAASNEDFPAPQGLNGDLRPYQRAGVAWMTALIESRFGGILADDMGLGKTMQVIATHLWIQNNTGPNDQTFGPTLVVAPAGLLHNWSTELARWAPGYRIHRYHGPTRSLKEVGDGDIVLTTYGIVRRESQVLAGRGWGLVVADEAQAMKNHLSATAKSMRRVPSKVRFALTGTPVENHLGELWSILEWTTPGLLGSLQHFQRSTVIPIERDGDAEAEARLTRIVAPFMLRRTKSDPRIVPELPPRTITDHVVPATTEQAVLYKAASKEILESVSSSSGMARRGAIFKLLTALKQVANHPAQFLREDGPLQDRSGKFELALSMVGEIIESGQSVVVFTQYVQMAKLLVEGLAASGSQPQMLHGGATLNERTSMVDRFQDGDIRILVVSLRAGGVGLNLTAATHVIHYDRWWNPAVENQASDRVWRIGQTKPVQVHRLITEGTLEEKIALLLESKQRLAERVIDSNAWITELNDQQLSDLVTLDESALPGQDDDGD